MSKEKNIIRILFDKLTHPEKQGGEESGVDWDLANKPAAKWAKEHAGESFTTDPEELRIIRDAVSRYFLEGWNQGELCEELTPPKGPFTLERAEVIARTEVTRAASEGERGVAAQAASHGVKMQPIWQTRNDDFCCDICRSRNQGIIGVDFEEVYPPAHDGCRCWVTHEYMRLIDD